MSEHQGAMAVLELWQARVGSQLVSVAVGRRICRARLSFAALGRISPEWEFWS